MATVQDPVKQPGARHERFVEDQIAQATRRVRMLDVMAAALGLAIGVMGFGLAMILIDRWLQLPSLARQVAFLGFAAVALAYTWFVLLRPFRKRINPYYAAKQVEQTIPDAKNSLVNWLDLHGENLPPSVRDAIGQRAAEDLEGSDVEQAIKGKHLVWLGTVVAALGVGLFLAFAAMRHDQFFSLIDRAFNPFNSGAIAQQTQIKVTVPDGGNAIVPVNRSVEITVEVKGQIPEPNQPDSLTLLFRHNPDDPNWVSRPLDKSDEHHTIWTYRVPPDLVQNGFWYKVVGGDGQTPVYRVQVRSSPMLTRFDVTYKYRPYLHMPERTVNDPNLDCIRGTEITMIASANRKLKEGRMIDGQNHVLAATNVLPDQPDALKFHLVPDRDAKYRIVFTTSEGEEITDGPQFTLHVTPDNAPVVEITKPEQLNDAPPKNVLRIPADGVRQLAGAARDDFGITKVALHMVVKDIGRDRTLPPQEFRNPAAFRLDNGTFMKSVEYFDFIDVAKLVASGAIRVGDTVKFWLQAEDNCDNPKPNVGKSKEYEFMVDVPTKDDKANDDQRKTAEQDKAEHDKKHDDQRAKDNDEAKKEDEKNAQNNAKDKQDQNKNDDGNKSDADKKFQDLKKEKEEEAKNDANKNDQPKPDDKAQAKPDNADQPKPMDQPNQDPNKDAKDNPPKADQKNNGGQDDKKNPAADMKDKGNNPQDGGAPGENKNPPPDKPDPKADAKDKGDSTPNKDGPGDAKKPMDPMAADKPADAKDKGKDQKPMDGGNDPMGNPDAKKKEPGEAKGNPQKNQPNPMDDPKNAKDPMGNPDPKQNQNANGQKDNPADAKPDNKNKQADAKQPPKPAPEGQDKDKGQPGGDAKPDPKQQAQKPQGQPKADNKPNPKGGEPGEMKPNDKPGQNDQKADAKQPPQNDPMKSGESQAAADSKPDNNKGQQNANKQPNDNQGKPGGDKNKDIAQKGEQMKNGNPQQREQAKKDLENIAKNDPNPDRKKAAEDAMKKAEEGKRADAKSPPKDQGKPGDQPQPDKKDQVADGKPAPKPGDKSGEEKPKPGDPKQAQADKKDSKQAQANKDKADSKSKPPSDAAAGECKNPGDGTGQSQGQAKADAKGGGKQGGDKPGEGKGAGPKKDDAVAQNDKGQPNPGDPKSGKPMPGDPKNSKPQDGNGPGQGQPDKDKAEAKNDKGAPGEGKGDPNQDSKIAGNDPGIGSNDAQRTGPSGNSTPEDRGKWTDPNKAFLDKAGDLTLDEFKKRVTKEDLQKHGISDAEWQKYLADMEKRMKDQQNAKNNVKDDVKAADKQKGSIANSGVRQVKTDPTGKVGDVHVDGASVAPPEYKDAGVKFSELLSKPRPKKK